jgi:hypothetical protein
MVVCPGVEIDLPSVRFFVRLLHAFARNGRDSGAPLITGFRRCSAASRTTSGPLGTL